MTVSVIVRMAKETEEEEEVATVETLEGVTEDEAADADIPTHDHRPIGPPKAKTGNKQKKRSNIVVHRPEAQPGERSVAHPFRNLSTTETHRS